MDSYLNKVHEVLIEGNSKKSDDEWYGRTTQNTVVVFPKTGNEKVGDFVNVLVVYFGNIIGRENLKSIKK